jgi:RNA-directed DNA polymerase
MNLEVSEEKSRITNANEGFDFLGWTFKNYPSYKGGKKTLTTLVKPSEKSIQKHKEKLKLIWRAAVGNKLHIKIRELNQVIIGWATYHRKVNSNKIFRSLDHFIYLRTVRYLRRSHPNKSWAWLIGKYFTQVGNDKWVFQDPATKIKLVKYKSFKIIEHIPIRYGMNPYDPNPEVQQYFTERKKSQAKTLLEIQESKSQMAKWQDDICPICGENIYGEVFDDDVTPLLHVHHLIPRKQGGKDVYSNLMGLHDWCHRTAHKRKLSKQNLIDNLIRCNPTPTSSFRWEKDGFKEFPSKKLSPK